MKGYNAASTHPPVKRRWTCFSVTVPIIVFLSLIGTVSVLLGLHNRFPSGYTSEESASLGNSLANVVEKIDGNPPQKNETRINQLIEKFTHTLPQKVIGNNTGRDIVVSQGGSSNDTGIKGKFISPPKDDASHATPEGKNSKGPIPHDTASRAPPRSNTRDGRRPGQNNIPKDLNGDATEKSCQVEFGSYCLWSIEHKEAMIDSVVRRLKDQLFMARAYYPSIAKLRALGKFSRDMKQNIQDHEKMLSEAISDPDLPSSVQEKIKKMDQTIRKAKSQVADCNNVDKKLRQILYLTEDEAHFHMKQSAFLHHLGVQTMPKSHHCLSMRLTVEYFRLPPGDIEQSHVDKLDNPQYLQYVIFSRNVLAVSVAINSTVMKSKETGNMVFNVLTDEDNFYAMKLWFSRNAYKEAVVHVINVEDLKMNGSYDVGRPRPRLSASEEFRVSVHTDDQHTHSLMRTEYVSVFGHSHFLLPEIFKNLKKVVVLDDDVVVQRDLSSLWNIDLHGNVNGAVQFCGLKLGQLKTYLGNNKNDESCMWMSALNILDLQKWRELNITGKYRQSLSKLHNGSEASWRAAALPASLLAFRDLIYPLDDSWVVSGLGYNYSVDEDTIMNSGVLHYNGNMKPWLDLGISKYKNYWKKFLVRGESFMDQCNINR